jgi:hypothetical protein
MMMGAGGNGHNAIQRLGGVAEECMFFDQNYVRY